MKSLKLFSLLISVPIFLLGCGEDKKLKEHRKDALNISGSYLAVQGDKSTMEMGITIQNEDGKNDIAVFLDRNRVSNAEKAFYIKFGITENQAELLIRYISLGVGKKSWQESGKTEWLADNISNDKGSTSIFYVCSQLISLEGKRLLRHCMDGSKKSAENFISGRLTSSIYRDRKNFDVGAEEDTLGQAFQAELD